MSLPSLLAAIDGFSASVKSALDTLSQITASAAGWGSKLSVQTKDAYGFTVPGAYSLPETLDPSEFTNFPYGSNPSRGTLVVIGVDAEGMDGVLMFYDCHARQYYNAVKKDGVWQPWDRMACTRDLDSLPYINMMPDSGRFAGRINPLSTFVGSFVTSAFFSPYNGATLTDGGKAIYDNTNFGGTRGVMNQDVVDLLTAQGRAGERYPVEFNICNLKAGTGLSLPITASNGLLHYLTTVNNAKPLFAVAKWGTCAFWIRAKTGSVCIRTGDILTYDGEVVAPMTAIGNEWTLVYVSSKAPRGYDNAFPWIYATPGADVQLALPAFFSGLVTAGDHVSPVPTINELSV